jgi:SAM-dependent methyltransferase
MLTDAARFWDHQSSSAAVDDRTRQWTESGDVLQAINRRVTGDPFVPPLHALADLLRRNGGAGRALSVGCGGGALERFLAGTGAVGAFDGIDISAVSLEHATAAAEAEGLSDRLRYRQADALTWLRQAKDGAYGLIVFHQSLHHIAELEPVLEECARVLRGGAPGWLYLDEFIGPAAGRWTDADLQPAREIYAELPASLRAAGRLEAPIDPDDPSEMICADQIEPLVRVLFDVMHYRPYFGNVLFPLLAGLRAVDLDSPEARTVVEKGLACEEELIAGGGTRPLFAVFLAKPADPEAAAHRRARWRAAQDLDPHQLLQRSEDLETTLRRQLRDVQDELARYHEETARLSHLLNETRKTRAWRLHAWIEKHLRAPWRRLLNSLKPR